MGVTLMFAAGVAVLIREIAERYRMMTEAAEEVRRLDREIAELDALEAAIEAHERMCNGVDMRRQAAQGS